MSCGVSRPAALPGGSGDPARFPAVPQSSRAPARLCLGQWIIFN